MKKSNFYFAHGAGADSQSEFMQSISKLLASETLQVQLFDFPYMQRRKLTGKKSPPDRMDTLVEAFKKEIDPKTPFYIGGKSMGGRVATMIADNLKQENYPIQGVIAFGYPFHPPAKPEKLRTEHLQAIATPTLIIQGTRDNFGMPEEVETYSLSQNIKLKWIQDGNHSLETLKRSELSTEEAWKKAASLAKKFMLQNL